MTLFSDIKISIYKTIIVPLSLYGYEAWVLTHSDEKQNLGVLKIKNKVKKVF